MAHPCAPGAERARCDALPGQHTEHAPAENVQLFGPLTAVVGSTASTASGGQMAKPAATAFTGLVFFAREPSKRGLPQANRITLTVACRCNNSLGDDFYYQFRRAAALVKLS
jgi:hypothetical protein